MAGVTYTCIRPAYEKLLGRITLFVLLVMYLDQCLGTVPKCPTECHCDQKSQIHCIGGKFDVVVDRLPNDTTHFTYDATHFTYDATHFTYDATDFTYDATDFTYDATDFTYDATDFTYDATDFTYDATDFTYDATDFTYDATDFTYDATDFTYDATDFTYDATDFTYEATDFTYEATDFTYEATDAITTEEQIKVSFDHLPLLQELNIRKASNVASNLAINKFEISEIFAGLELLRTLRVNLLVSDINSSLLLPLTQLTTLDLSNSTYLTSNKFASLFVKSKLNQKPLKHIILRRMSRWTADSTWTRFNLSHIFHLFEGMDIKTLDVSENDEISIFPGLLKYTQKLETFIAGGNKYKYIVNHALCYILDIWLHQSMKVLHLSNIGEFQPVEFNDDSTVRLEIIPISFLQEIGWCMLFGTCTVCDVYNLQCGPFIGNTACNLLPSPDSLFRADSSCNPPYRVWFPQNLESMHLHGITFEWFGNNNLNYPNSRIDLCFIETKLRFLDVSDMKFTAETVEYIISRDLHSYRK